MISKSNVKFTGGEFYSCWKIINCVPCDSAFVVIFLKTMNNKTIIRFVFFHIRNNQCQGSCDEPQPLASADDTYTFARFFSLESRYKFNIVALKRLVLEVFKLIQNEEYNEEVRTLN